MTRLYAARIAYKKDICTCKRDICAYKRDIRIQKRHMCIQNRHRRIQKRHICIPKTRMRIQKRHICIQKRHTRIQTRHIRIQKRHTRTQKRHMRIQKRHMRVIMCKITWVSHVTRTYHMSKSFCIGISHGERVHISSRMGPWHCALICDMTHAHVTWAFICDLTHSYVTWPIHAWHDSFIWHHAWWLTYDSHMWLPYDWHMTHIYCHICCHIRLTYVTHVWLTHDSHMLSHMTHIWLIWLTLTYDSHMWLTYVTHICESSHATWRIDVWHGTSYLQVHSTYFTCDMVHLYMTIWHDAFLYALTRLNVTQNDHTFSMIGSWHIW